MKIKLPGSKINNYENVLDWTIDNIQYISMDFWAQKTSTR